MAKDAAAVGEAGPAGEKPSGLLGFVIAMLIATVVAAAGGGIFGLYGLGKSATHEEKKIEKPAAPKPRFADGLELKPLTPIVTDLAGPRGTWIRLESALVIDAAAGREENVLAARIAEDIIAFLRTVPLRYIEGANGFQNLREDLNERVRVRSEGKVHELVIQSLIVE